MKRYSLKVSVVGPIMATGLDAVAHGVDASFLRDHLNRIVLPGAQIRGIARHTLKAMSLAASDKLSPKHVEQLFGQASGDVTKDDFGEDANIWAPAAGKIRFSDLVAVDRNGKSSTLTRIAVDSFTGSVLPGHLQVLEQPIGIGETVDFIGTVDIDAVDDEADQLIEWIYKALLLTPAIGANKSAGFGRVAGISKPEAVDIKQSAALSPNKLAAILEAGAAEITLDFDEPFLVSAGWGNSNLYAGDTVVAGSVLKAVIGRSIGAEHRDHPLHDALSGLVINELRPAKPDGNRPQTAPVSLYCVGDETALLDALIDPHEEWAASGEVVAFRPDWKPGSTGDTSCRREYPNPYDAPRIVRTRTAVNEDGTADTGKLFTFAAIDPVGFVWKGRISKGSLSTDRFAALLGALPSVLHGIGKTRTSARLAISAPVQSAPKAIAGDVVVVLETDACLHTPSDVHDFSEAEGIGEQLRLQYQRYFAEALRSRASDDAPAFADEDLKLVFMATQRRVGGYVSGRYPPSSLGYHPWLLTEAGSSFRLEIPKGLEGAAASFLQCGLPVPKGFDAARSAWSGNPFVPENGFGEVRIRSVG